MERDPTLISYVGLQGEENRQKLADTFLRPTRWKDYCLDVSANNCSTPDEFAQRAPAENDEEGEKYFVRDAYTGHFRKTDANNCTVYPTNCTGHVVDYPCEWTSFAEPLFHHLDIALSGDRHGQDLRGHDDWDSVDILEAAIATKSNIMIMWAEPDPNYQRLIGTDMELHAVVFPPATQECLDNKRSWEDMCSADWEARVGDPRGACDDPPQLLYKSLSTALTDELNDPRISDAEKSPVVPAMQQFTLTTLLYGSYFDLLKENDALGESRATLMRDVTCQWVVDHIDTMQSWVPFSYPRVITQKQENVALTVTSIALACLALVMALCASAIVHLNQGRRVMIYAQVDFLRMLLAGLVLMSIGALLTAVPPTVGTCIAAPWFQFTGYTLELAPLLVKVAAINRLMHGSTRMKKVKIKREHLFRSVCAIVAVIVIYLIIWSAVDAPELEGELSLSTDLTARNETIVRRSNYCASDTDVWSYIAMGWLATLLFSSTVLAFQMRHVRQEFNESQTLGLMTYSHFIFMILRFIILFLDDLSHSDRSSYTSIMLSIDCVATLLIYFLPKIAALRDADVTQSITCEASYTGGTPNLPGKYSGQYSRSIGSSGPELDRPSSPGLPLSMADSVEKSEHSFADDERIKEPKMAPEPIQEESKVEEIEDLKMATEPIPENRNVENIEALKKAS